MTHATDSSGVCLGCAEDLVMQENRIDLVQWTDELAAWTRLRAMEVDSRVRGVVRERPLLSLLGAAVFGVLAGRILSRR